MKKFVVRQFRSRIFRGYGWGVWYGGKYVFGSTSASAEEAMNFLAGMAECGWRLDLDEQGRVQ